MPKIITEEHVEENRETYPILSERDNNIVIGDDALRKIALKLTDMIRNNVTIDWTQRESVQAELIAKGGVSK